MSGALRGLRVLAAGSAGPLYASGRISFPKGMWGPVSGWGIPDRTVFSFLWTTFILTLTVVCLEMISPAPLPVSLHILLLE